MNRLEQRHTALAVIVAFVIATIAIPTAHLVVHTLPHDHASGGIHYHVELPGDDHHDDEGDHHHHGGADHHHDDADRVGLKHSPHDQAEPPHDHPQQPFDPHHGDGSAAHFSLAISDAAASLPSLPLLGLFLAGRVPAAPRPLLACAQSPVRRVRGPPAIA